MTMTNGRWTPARHLLEVNRALVEVACGDLKRLMVFMPPRSGKSELGSRYFPAWVLGHFPDRRILFCAYGDVFARLWGRRVRNTVREARQLGVFEVDVSAESAAANEWEIAGHEGGMMTAGVGSGITGRGADHLLLDDPIKSREQADSATYRDRVWEWYHDDAYTRLEPGGTVTLIQTRWHHDDLAGRLLAQQPGEWTVISLSAIAEEGDPLGRQVGEALWPERFPIESLEQSKAVLGSYSFAALYQQRPTPREGGMFKRQWFEIVSARPQADKRARFWDLGGTIEGDPTAGVLMAHNGVYYVEDVQWLQGTPAQARALVIQTARLDGRTVPVYLEQEPGQSGLDQVQSYAKHPDLQGYAVRGIRSTGSKQLRADPVAAQCEVGNVKLVSGPWNEAFLEEVTQFPQGAHDDQVDGLSGAFEQLTTPMQVQQQVRIVERPKLWR